MLASWSFSAGREMLFIPSVWPGLICAPVCMLHRTAPVITIKQLLSLDIIKAGQNVEGGVNPQDPSLGVEEEGTWWWGVQSMIRQTDEQTYRVLFGHSLKWKPSDKDHITIDSVRTDNTSPCFTERKYRCIAISINWGRERGGRNTQEYSGKEFNQRSMLMQSLWHREGARKGSGLSASQHVTKLRPADILITRQEPNNWVGRWCHKNQI